MCGPSVGLAMAVGNQPKRANQSAQLIEVDGCETETENFTLYYLYLRGRVTVI